MPIRRRRVLRLEGIRPPQDLRSDRVSDVAELRVLFDERGNHRAEGDDAFAVRTGRLESFPHQDVRLAASAEPFIDLGVVENQLVVVVSDGGEPDGLAVDGDGVLPVCGANGGLGAGLVRGHLRSLAIRSTAAEGRGRSRVAGSAGAGSLAGVPW